MKDIESNNNNKQYINCERKIKHFPPFNRTWYNSVYFFNNEIIKPLPLLNKILFKLIREYFNTYSYRLKKKLKKKISKYRFKRIILKKARLSIKNILVSKPELKHTNNKIMVTIYVYNAEKKYFLNKIKKRPSIYKLNIIKPKKKDINRKKSFNLVRNTKNLSFGLKTKLQNHQKSFNSIIKKNFLKLEKKINTYQINRYQNNYMKNFIYKSLRKEIISIYFKQLLTFNKNKFEKKYISLLVNEIKKIYNKNIEFNFVNLKYLYLDNYIFSTALTIKIKKLMKIKKNFMRAIKKSLNMINIPYVESQNIYNEMIHDKIIIQNLDISNNILNSLFDKISYTSQNEELNLLNKLNNYNISDDITINFNNINKNLNGKKHFLKLVQVFKSTKYKFLNGVRIEIAGRLSRRRSAARSIFKIRNKGNIRNKDSSDTGLSTVILRGFAKSNLQYNNIHSKVRGGSFGLKGWISGN